MEKKHSIIWFILTFFCPPVGLVCYFVWRKNEPKQAKAILKMFSAGIVFAILLGIATTLILNHFGFNMFTFIAFVWHKIFG